MLFFVISPFVCPLLLHTPACDHPGNTALPGPGQLVVLGWASGGREVPRLHVEEAFMNILHEMYHISMIYQSSPLPPIYQVFWPGLPPAISCGYHNGAVCSPSSRADTFKTILCSARVKWGSPVHFYFCPSVEAAGVIVLDLHCCNLLFNLSPQFEQN